LISYVDMDRLIAAADGAFSWATLIERAERFRVRAAVSYGLQCAHDLLETPLPAEVQAALGPGRLQWRALHRLAPLDQEVVLHLPNMRLRGWKQVLLHMALADSLGAAAGVLQSLLFPDREWLAARYPMQIGGRVSLYRLVRLLHLTRAFLESLQPLPGHGGLGDSRSRCKRLAGSRLSSGEGAQGKQMAGEPHHPGQPLPEGWRLAPGGQESSDL
jgi:hypothetical protein